MIVEGVNDHKG